MIKYDNYTKTYIKVDIYYYKLDYDLVLSILKLLKN